VRSITGAAGLRPFVTHDTSNKLASTGQFRPSVAQFEFEGGAYFESRIVTFESRIVTRHR
jgi:hypothetical protein